MCDELDKIARTVYDRLQRHGLKGRTITLKIKYHNFKQVTRSQSLVDGVGSLETISFVAKKLLEATDLEDVRIRLLGISISNFHDLKYEERMTFRSVDVGIVITQNTMQSWRTIH